MTQQKFRVGITPDWGEQTDAIVGPALREVFDPISDLEYEIMPGSPDLRARPEVIDQYDALLVFGYYFPTESFEGVSRLKCLARWGVGYDRIDVEACTQADVLIALTPTTIRRTVSEGILSLIFALAKNLRRLDLRVREGRWRDNLQCEAICVIDRTLGSIGVGNIAGELFRMARGLGFKRLLGYDPYCTPEHAAELGVELVDLDTLLAESDFVTINTPLTPETLGLMDRRAFSLMKPTAYFINTSRGQVVDEEALVEALRERRIAGAGIDVLCEEPPPKDHPLFELDNVILAPHSVAWTEEGLKGNSLEACTNIRSVYRGEAPPFLANPQAIERPGVQSKLAAWRKAS